jgi:hypothetical protein
MEGPVNDNLPQCELAERMTLHDQLAATIEHAREAMSLRVGYELEMAGIEPILRDGRENLRVYWRRKLPELHVVQ